MTRLYNWHRSNERVAVYVPHYNQRGLLQSEWLHVRARKITDIQTGAINFVSDPARRQQAIQDIRYNAKGQKEWLKLGNGTETTYTYDSETFRLTSLRTVRQVTPRGLQDLAYTYDPVGNITRIVDTAQETVWHDNARIEPKHDYVYDALYRLIEATGRENGAAMSGTPPSGNEGPWPTGPFPTHDSVQNYTQRYRYDAVGNFRTMTHGRNGRTAWIRQYAYAFDDPSQPASNRLWRTWHGSGAWNPDDAHSVTYGYDSHGSMLNLNRVEIPPPQAEDWGHQIYWDWRDMIQRFDAIGGGWARYHYGIDKQRTRKHITRNGGEVQDRLYLGGYELYRRTSASGETLEEIESHHLFEGELRVLLVDDVIFVRQSSQPGPNRLSDEEPTLFRYQYGNHLGSVALELDGSSDARIISYEEFHPYGTNAYRLMNTSFKAPAKRYRYTGMERDEESGLSYHTARCYLPWLGRWGSADPIFASDGFNLYANAKNSPIIFTDNKGTQSKSKPDSDKFSRLPSWMQKKILSGGLNDKVSNALKTWTPNVQENENAQKGCEFSDEILLGDFYEGESSSLGIAGQIVVGFIPGVGQAADIRDLAAALHGNYEGTKGLGSIFFAGVAFVPGIGDGAKAIYKTASRLPPPRLLSSGVKDLNRILIGAYEEGRHILRVDLFDEAGKKLLGTKWVISGAGGKSGHTEFAAIKFIMENADLLKKIKNSEEAPLLLLQGVLNTCTTRNGQHSCHDVLRNFSEKLGVDIIYDTNALRKDFGLPDAGAVAKLYEAGMGYLKKYQVDGQDVWTQAPQEVKQKLFSIFRNSEK